MSNISLSKALKIKNRIAKEIKDLQTIISQNNSSVVGNKASFDIKESYDELLTLKNKLGELKMKINIANSGIVGKMVEINELKSHIVFLRTIDTSEGMTNISRYETNLVEKTAVFDALFIRNEVKNTQTKIDSLQDEIDKYNATTTIEYNYEL